MVTNYNWVTLQSLIFMYSSISCLQTLRNHHDPLPIIHSHPQLSVWKLDTPKSSYHRWSCQTGHLGAIPVYRYIQFSDTSMSHKYPGNSQCFIGRSHQIPSNIPWKSIKLHQICISSSNWLYPTVSHSCQTAPLAFPQALHHPAVPLCCGGSGPPGGTIPSSCVAENLWCLVKPTVGASVVMKNAGKPMVCPIKTCCFCPSKIGVLAHKDCVLLCSTTSFSMCYHIFY